MIIEEIPKLKSGKIKSSYKILCECDGCLSKFRRKISILTNKTLCRSCTTTAYNKNRDPSIHKKMIDNAAKIWTGKTRIEVCGLEKAKAASLSQSQKNSGSNNPNFGGKYSKGFADNPLIGTFEHRFGKDEADRRKYEMSKRNSGSNNPMYGKQAPKKSGNGISGWWKNKLYFRSLLELSFILKCELEGKHLSCAERKEYRIEYEFYGVKRTYVPDFVDEHGTLFECKPAKLLNSEIVKAKLLAAPHVKIITDEELVRPTPNELKILIDTGCVIIDPSKTNRIKI